MSETETRWQDEPFGNEDDGWDVEDTGRVGISLFGKAVQVWAVYNGDKVTVADAAKAFCTTSIKVRQAIEDHPWMFVSGPDRDPSKQFIEHEGE